MAEFNPGEIAILVYGSSFDSLRSNTPIGVVFGSEKPFPKGTECTVIKKYLHPVVGQGYLIFPQGAVKEYFVLGEWLRKKRPPEELTTWSKIEKISGWNPVKVTV